jgi:alpha-1,2-mannosyltransferase
MVSFLELLVLICCAITFFVVAFRVYFWRLRNSQATGSRKKRIAFFHPYCLAGGGGERVLWKAVQALDDLCDEGFSIEVIVYTVDKECANYNDSMLYE